MSESIAARSVQSARSAIRSLLHALLGAVMSMGTFPVLSQAKPPVTEGYSQDVAAALLKKRQDEDAAKSRASNGALEALFTQDFRWQPGQEIIVAFYGGSYPVWAEIARLADTWAKYANITFNFGLNPAKKTARTWQLGDPVSIAHIRIRLDEDVSGRSSAVGTQTFYSVFSSGSMVLAGLANSYPLWTGEDRADVIHEFGHALGFFHEQQRAECLKDFRREKGSNGEPTIYDLYWQVYQWPREKTESNLKLDEGMRFDTLGKPDANSIMLYPTPDKLLPATLSGTKGPCYVKTKNKALSKTDIVAAQQMYPGKGVVALDAGPSEARRNVPVLQTLAASVDARDRTVVAERIAVLDKSTRPLVWIHYGDAVSRDNALKIQSSARNEGYVAPGIEKIVANKVPKALEVRYFRVSDKEVAAHVADLVGDQEKTSASLKYIPKYGSVTKPGTIEVWFPIKNSN